MAHWCRRAISLRSMSTSPRVSVLTWARLRICLARAAKARVDWVSWAESALGLTLAMMVVLELPPSESWARGKAQMQSMQLTAETSSLVSIRPKTKVQGHLIEGEHCSSCP